jgi:hypothetical protein
MSYRTRNVGRLAAGLLALAALACGVSRVQAQALAPPVPVAPAPQLPQGQWVATAQYGYVWVPTGASVVDLGGVPSVYLFTPSYGWNWYASPWGWGPFAHGSWVHGPWPYGFRVWHHGAHGWGFYGGPHAHFYGAPRTRYYVAPRPYFHPFHHRRRGRWGGHRFYR